MRYGVIGGGPTKTAIETVTVFSRQFPGFNSHAVRLSPTDGSNSRMCIRKRTLNTRTRPQNRRQAPVDFRFDHLLRVFEPGHFHG